MSEKTQTESERLGAQAKVSHFLVSTEQTGEACTAVDNHRCSEAGPRGFEFEMVLKKDMIYLLSCWLTCLWKT